MRLREGTGPPLPQGTGRAQLCWRRPQSGIPGPRQGWGGGESDTRTQPTHGPQHTRTHRHKLPIRTFRYANTHTARSHSRQKHGDTRSHTYTLAHTAVPAGREAAQSCGVDRGSVPGDPGVRGASCPPREGAPTGGRGPGPARAGTSQPRPATASAARPPPPPARCSPGGAPQERPPARPPRAPRGPRRPPPAPGPPRHRPRAPRGPGAASEQPAASAAQNLRNNKQPDMSESAAAGPPFSLPSLRPGPTREGRGRRRDNLFRARAPHTNTRGAHTHTHTHNPDTAPSGGPRAPGHTLGHRPGAHHTRNIPGHAASTHGHTHTLTSAPDTLLHTHSRHTWHSLGPTQPPAAHTTNPRHSHTYTSRTQRTDTHVPDPFPRLHTRTRTSQAHTPHTRSPIHTRAESTEHSRSHA